MTQPSDQDWQVLLLRRLATLDTIGRTKAKAERGVALKEWSLGVPRNLMDAGSSLALDDTDFLPEYAPGIVNMTAVFPVMAAIDSLIAVSELIEGRDDSEGRTGSGMGHAVSLLTLCRQATEASARTIWLLSSTDRAMRRNLAVRFSLSEMDAQKGFHRSSRIWFGEGGGKDLRAEQEKFDEHVRFFDKRVEILEQARRNTPKVAVLGNKDLVESSARWIDQNPPRHEPNGPLGREGFGFEQAAGAFYGVSSGIVHGLKWIADYMPYGELDLHRVIVECLNNAVCMVECAVALFEAQAQDWHTTTARPRLYPELLQPTIDQWAELYPGRQAHGRTSSSD